MKDYDYVKVPKWVSTTLKNGFFGIIMAGVVLYLFSSALDTAYNRGFDAGGKTISSGVWLSGHNDGFVDGFSKGYDMADSISEVNDSLCWSLEYYKRSKEYFYERYMECYEKQ